jgi:hypothetical protein
MAVTGVYECLVDVGVTALRIAWLSPCLLEWRVRMVVVVDDDVSQSQQEFQFSSLICQYLHILNLWFLVIGNSNKMIG